ncbi:MAG: aspartate aminotransferase family protein [Candidatus Brocadiae bacterium]|nr:aspartate aminotransferase family protein [Candidatus Brocadiia bacterium]
MKNGAGFWTSETQMYYDRNKIVRAEGCYLWDENGKQYLDGISGMWNVFLGHGRKEFAEALSAQTLQLDYMPNMRFYHGQGERLADRLTNLLPEKFSHVYFTSGGAEAVETSLKIARQYWYNRNFGNKTKYISLYESYHGTTLGAMSVSGDPWDRIPFNPLLYNGIHTYPQYCYKCKLGLSKEHCHFACLKDLEYQIDFYGAENIAAFILEPVMGVGGVIIPDKEYLERIVHLCREKEILLIFDEITSGIGRTGTYFACMQYEIYPDIILFGKGISNGIQPLAGAIVKDKIFDIFCTEKIEEQFRHGFTNSGHPVCCTAGNIMLDIMKSEDINRTCSEKGLLFKKKIEDLKKEVDFIGEIRVIGLMIAIELVCPRTSEGLNIPGLDFYLKQQGLLVSQLCQVVCLMPSVIISEDQMDDMLRILKTAIKTNIEKAGFSK